MLASDIAAAFTSATVKRGLFPHPPGGEDNKPRLTAAVMSPKATPRKAAAV
jgi:hypothetical protein